MNLLEELNKLIELGLVKVKKYEKAAKKYGISGIKVDGKITIKEMKKINSGGEGLANRICVQRISYMQGLKGWKKYGKGWSKRVYTIKAL
jgi:lysozyme family protein